ERLVVELADLAVKARGDLVEPGRQLADRRRAVALLGLEPLAEAAARLLELGAEVAEPRGAARLLGLEAVAEGVELLLHVGLEHVEASPHVLAQLGRLL